MTDPATSQPVAGPSTTRAQPTPRNSDAQAGLSTTKAKKSKKKGPNPYTVTRDEATKALSQKVNAQPCWEVHDMPGIMTCGELSQWGLAVVSDWNLLACTKCPKGDRIMDFWKVREHVKTHFPRLKSSVTSRQIRDVCLKYGVIPKSPRDIETPRHGLAPLEFLQRYQLWKCTVCEDREIDFYSASERNQRRHHSEKHNNYDPKYTYNDRDVWAQTFFSENSENKIWFEIDTRALHVPKIDIDHGFQPDPNREATAEEMLRAYQSLWTPLQHAPVQVDELRDVMPMLHITGFAHHAGNRTKELRPLVLHEGPDDPYKFIYNAATERWGLDQKRILEIFDPLRVALLNDESGKPAGMFMPLAEDSSPNYGDLWGRWCMFICRLRARMKAKDKSYVVPMTEEQIKWVDQALLYCTGSGHAYHVQEILYQMSAAFWRPIHDHYFDTLAKDKFSDATARFACLINIRETGEFSTPSNVCHELVRMKYVMRQVLYYWSEHDHEVAGQPLSGAVEAISHAISRRRASPFSVICSWAAHAATYTHTTVALPSVSWTTDTSLSVHGYQVSVPHLGNRIAAEIRALEKLLQDNLLLGLTPEELGFRVTETTPIVDNLGNTDVDGSMFDDPHLASLDENLMRAFADHPQAAFLFNRIGIDKNAASMFKYDGCAKWLESVNIVNRKIMLLLHMTGGQSGRGAELVGIRYMNTSSRRRSLYMIAPGLMALLRLG
ncbi:hypothetical protein FRC12_002654 [Ceratobasidium sp. 428]|nr:hypothetical protein FRC12_002654 [Ceratobasidium sp. 428]